MPGHTSHRFLRKHRRRFNLTLSSSVNRVESSRGSNPTAPWTFPRLKVLSAAITAITQWYDALIISLRELLRFDNSFVHQLCLIIGLASLSVFSIDIVVTALPLQPFNPGWQTDVINNIADRSLVGLIGIGLLAFPLSNIFFFKRPFSLLCLLLGVMYLLLSIPLFRGVLALRNNATFTIGQQESQAIEQLEALQLNPPEGVTEIPPEQIENASQQIQRQAEARRRNAQQLLYKTLATAIGNLWVAGIATIALSRLVARED
jgi:hypothetical protein